MIRRVSTSDILQVIKLAKSFWQESNCQSLFGEFDVKHYQRSLIQLIELKLIFGWASFDKNDNMQSILIACKDAFLGKPINFLKEIMWYSLPEYRGLPSTIKLQKEMEKFAKENSYAGIIMGRIQGPDNYNKLDQFYTKNNFKSLEDTYIKML